MTSKKERKPRGKKLMIRGLPQTGYAALSTRFIQDSAVTGEARIVGAYLLSKSSDWEVDVEHLRLHFRWSVERIYRYLGELVVHGYCIRRRLQNEAGTFDGSEYVISDDKERIRAIYFEWQREGYSFYPSDEKRWSKSDADEAPKEGQSKAPSSVIPNTVKPYTENPNTELYRDTTKSPHPNPPQPSASQTTDENSTAPASRGAEGSAGKETGQKPLPPVTFGLFWKHYEPYRNRHRDKAEDAWNDASEAHRLHAYSVLGQYFAHCARISKKPEEAWRFLRLGLFRQYALPRAAGDPPPPRELPPEPDQVLASALGLRAANGRWVLELIEFIERHRRVPDEGDCAQLERAGAARHRELLAEEADVKAGRMIGPMVGVFLGKRRNLIAKALRMHGKPVPIEEPHSDPPKPAPMRAETDEFADLHYGSGR